jgi:hypothetical protein
MNFITIGNFFADSASTHVTCSSTPTYLYYYLDDVSVVEVFNANAGNDTTMCVGETISIGGPPTFAADYVWYELADSTGSSSIDSVNIARPHISPTQTTTYVMWKRQCNVVTMDTVTVTVNCVGMKETEKKPELNVYPNPANEGISVSYAGNASEISIHNVVGKEIKRFLLKDNKVEIDTAELEEGIYFGSVLDTNRTVATKKIVVQH